MKLSFTLIKCLFIGYCILLMVYQCLELSSYGNEGELYFDACIRMIIYIIWLIILSIRRRWIWFFGVLFFSLGIYDVFYKDITNGIPRAISSSYAYFDLVHPFKGLVFSRNNTIFKNIGIFMYFIMYPAALILFFTNPVRRYFGLKNQKG